MRIIAIGAHPDDIELGCGGTLIKAAKAGHLVHLYVLTRGEASGDPLQRTREAMRAAKFMGAKALWMDNFQDANVQLNRDLINHIEYFISRAKADIVLTHSLKDYHHDHRAIARATSEAGRFCRNIMAYELPVTHSFEPQMHYDISDVLEKKVELISLFSSQREKIFTHADAITGLSKYRAFQSRLITTMDGVESFQVIRSCLNIDFALMGGTYLSLPDAVTKGLDLNSIVEYFPRYPGQKEDVAVSASELEHLIEREAR